VQKYRIYKSQIIAGTKEDSQGEKYSYDFFEDLVSQLPNRLPLNQQHDMRLETAGYLENFRLVPDDEEDGEWNVVADVYTTSTEIGRSLRGFSFSTIVNVWGKTSSPSCFIHLPYPLYRDEEFIDELITSDGDLCVGKWIKKSADPLTIGLIATAVALLLAPEWDIQYKNRVRPAMEKLLGHAKKILKKDVSLDLIQHVIGHQGENVKVYFVPDRGAELDCFSEALILKALRRVKEHMDADSKGKHIGFELIKLYYDKAQGQYVIYHVQYRDGSDVHIA